MFDSPLRFRYADGTIVEFPNWPQCRAKVARGKRRCRNEVLDQGQPGRYLPTTPGDPLGYEIDRLDEEEKLRAQLCRVHIDQEDVRFFCDHEAKIAPRPSLRIVDPGD